MTTSYRSITPKQVAHLHEYLEAAKRELPDWPKSEGMEYALDIVEGAKIPVRRGLRASIYRDGDDCSNGGISSLVKEVVVIGPGIPEIVEATEHRPAVEVGTITFDGKTTYHLRPVDETGKHYMFGGTFVHSPDSRFRKLFPFNGAVALHDRHEG